MTEPLLPKGLCQADYGSERVGIGIVARIRRLGRQHNGNVLQPRCGLYVYAQVEPRKAFTFDLRNEEIGRKHIEDFTGVGSVIDGNDVVAFT